MEYGASAVFHAAGVGPRAERPGPRANRRCGKSCRGWDGRYSKCKRHKDGMEAGWFVCGIPPVRIGAGVTPHGKTADAPYSRLRPPAGVRGRVVDGGHMPTQ